MGDGPAHNLSLSVEKITSSYDACAAECRQSDSLPTPGQARILPAAKTGVGPTPAGSGGSMAERYNAAVDIRRPQRRGGPRRKGRVQRPARARSPMASCHDRRRRVGPMLARARHRARASRRDDHARHGRFPGRCSGARSGPGSSRCRSTRCCRPEQYRLHARGLPRHALSRLGAAARQPPKPRSPACGRSVKVVVAGAEPGAQHPRLERSADGGCSGCRSRPTTCADEVAFWLYSSGSTGMPKGVRHVHSSPMETARLYGQGVLGIAEDDVVYLGRASSSSPTASATP